MAPIVVAVLAYLVIAPVLMSTISSLRLTIGVLPFESGASWSFANYAEVFLDPGTYEVLVNTLVFTAGSLVIALSLSIALAWLIERTDMPFRNVAFILVLASLGIPGVISGIAWTLLLNPTNGLVNIAIRALIPGFDSGPLNIFSMPGLIFAQGLTMVPVTFLLITAAFRAMDATLEDAALVAGAKRLTVLRRITLPMLAPALLSAAIYQFVNVVASFDLPLIIGLRGGIRLLSTQIFVETSPVTGLPNFGVASTYSMLLLVLALAPLIYYTRLISRSERFATISGRGYAPTRTRLGAWRPVAVAFVVVFAVVSLVLPLFVMVWTSLQPFYTAPSPASIARITLDAYGRMLTDTSLRSAALNTLIVGILTAAATMTLGFLVAWIIVRTKSRLRVVLDLLSFIPTALPGVTIGLSVLLFYLLVPLPVKLYGTIWIIVIGLTTQSISLAVRLMTGGIAQIGRELEEASDVSGAARRRTLWRVVLPLTRPVFLNGLLLVFMMSIEYLTVPLLLFTPKSAMLSTSIFSFWDHGDTAITAALGVVMVSVTITLSFVLRRFGGSQAG
jgi:iron(III) transport system permease protein